MITIKDLLEGTGGIKLTCIEDLDKFLKIASQKRWHWRNGQSVGELVSKILLHENVSMLVELDPCSTKKSKVIVFGFKEVDHHDHSIDWFVKNFTPKPKPNVKRDEILKWLYWNRISITLKNEQEGKEFFEIAKKSHWALKGFYNRYSLNFKYPCGISAIPLKSDVCKFGLEFRSHVKKISFVEFRDKNWILLK